MSQLFELPASYKKWTIGLLAVGIVALVYGIIVYQPWLHGHHGEHIQSTRFWAVLLQNSVYWLLTVNAAMFFICVTTLAMGGWQVAIKRVSEAISSVVPILGIITFIILMAIVWGGRTDIYHWLDPEVYVKGSEQYDKILDGKHGFLNPMFYSIFSLVSIFLWWLFGKKMRTLSLDSDKGGTMDHDTAKLFIKKNITVAAFFTVTFGLTVGSTIPWLWLMSVDPHWYSTMYSWYTFASTFVSGLSLIAIYVIYLRRRGHLEFATDEHLHDVAKFMFAFSIFWTYVWFSQYMLIWYSNQPEETTYFIQRIGTSDQRGPYTGIFFLNLLLNFIAPLLIFMTKSAKKNWNLVVVMSIVIIFGHWIDVFMMVMPATLHEHAELLPFEFGIAALFIGIIVWGVGRYFSANPLTQKNHPFLKESMIHHT